jgi:hypothetical protein
MCHEAPSVPDFQMIEDLSLGIWRLLDWGGGLLLVCFGKFASWKSIFSDKKLLVDIGGCEARMEMSAVLTLKYSGVPLKSPRKID